MSETDRGRRRLKGDLWRLWGTRCDRLPCRFHVIYSDVVKDSFSGKRFLLVLVYFAAPLLGVFLSALDDVLNRGVGIGIYWAQSGTHDLVTGGFFGWTGLVGQMFIALLAADLVAGEVERGTFPMLKSKPVKDLEIVLGKYLGSLTVLLILMTPVVFIHYIVIYIQYSDDVMVLLCSLDEIAAVAFLAVLVSGVISGIALSFSCFVRKSLHAVMLSLVGIFGLAFLPSVVGDSVSWIDQLSLNYQASYLISEVFYNVETTAKVDMDAWGVMLIFFGVHALLIFISWLGVSQKELS